MKCRKSLWIGLAMFAAGPAAAQTAPEPEAETEAGAAEEPPAEEPPAEDASQPDPQELANRIQELETRLEASEKSRRARFPVKLTGYGDIGFFAVQGDGSGFRRDVQHLLFPDHSDIAWVFYGDLLATSINSRGDVADLGDAPGVDRFDSVNSNGNPSFLVNELSLGIQAGLGSQAMFTTSLNFTPRSGVDFRLGDSFDLDVAQLEWMPTADGKHSIFVGKVDSVIGIEYKTRKAPQRFGIIPTLLARYTTGTAVGVKGRSKLLDDRLIIAAAITNGSFGTEQFHFFDEIDTNSFKTLSGRVAVRLPLLGGTFEAGPSGQWGAQDGAPTGGKAMWFYGVDAEFDNGRLDVKAQFLRGRAPGNDVADIYSLDLKNGGYLEADFLLTPIIGLLGRAEFRDAVVQQGMERLYITKNWRATAGVRLIFNPNMMVKAELAHNGEYGGLPSIKDDLITTSAVMAF